MCTLAAEGNWAAPAVQQGNGHRIDGPDAERGTPRDGA
jgi:hypothetical protein